MTHSHTDQGGNLPVECAEIKASSLISFEDNRQQVVARASKTLSCVKSARLFLPEPHREYDQIRV